jgi:copper resistance protein B
MKKIKEWITTVTLCTAIATPALFAAGADDPLRATLLFDRFEYQNSDEKATSWDTSAYIGYDINKIYLYSEGEKPKDGDSESENQLLISHAIAPFWDIQYGLGYDISGDSDQSWAVLAVSGLAPYFFETRAALLLGEDGNIGLRMTLEYEALLTQRLILTPSFEADLYSKDRPEMGIGKGISSIVAGMRLRYEIRREFAPYLGIERRKNYGNTADYNPIDETYATAGLRFWF